MIASSAAGPGAVHEMLLDLRIRDRVHAKEHMYEKEKRRLLAEYGIKDTEDLHFKYLVAETDDMSKKPKKAHLMPSSAAFDDDEAKSSLDAK